MSERVPQRDGFPSRVAANTSLFTGQEANRLETLNPVVSAQPGIRSAGHVTAERREVERHKHAKELFFV